MRRPHRPPGRNRPGLGPPLQRARARRRGLPPQRRPRPPFAPAQVEQIVRTVESHPPAEQGWTGHLWTLKKLREWVARTFGPLVSRGVLRRLLRRAGLTWKKVKKLLGKADPDKRAAHIERLLTLFEEVRGGVITLIYVDEAHFHRDLDPGSTWGRRGLRVWRRSACPKLAERLNCYGAYDFTHGECLLWQDGWCDGERTTRLLEELARWRADKRGRLVVIWDNAPCHIAKVVKAKAAELGIELVYLPGYSPDLNPVERLWGWLRDEVTRGHCYGSVAELLEAARAFIAGVNRDPVALVDRLWPKLELDPEFEEKLRISS
ncbi:MAG TPA: IS630 family transposase [Gemmataceae bacterium]|nr:IS630 family transposase [Gemmataceae bacterium]